MILISLHSQEYTIMSKHPTALAMAGLFVLGLGASGTAQAEEGMNYILETTLEDGYYGYAARTPESYNFVKVEQGVPVIYYPKNSGRTACPPFSGSKTFYVGMSNNGLLLNVKRGSQYSMASPYMKNRSTASGQMAAAGDVRTDQHYSCPGPVTRSGS